MINNTRYIFTLLTLLVVGAVSIVPISQNVSAAPDPLQISIKKIVFRKHKHPVLPRRNPESYVIALLIRSKVNISSMTFRIY